jgi:hypothetical protein
MGKGALCKGAKYMIVFCKYWEKAAEMMRVECKKCKMQAKSWEKWGK